MDTSEALVIRWLPDPSDVDVLFHRSGWRGQRTRIVVLSLLLIAAGLLVHIVAGLLGYGFAASGAFILLIYAFVPRYTRQLYWQRDPLAQEPVEYVLDQVGVHRRQPYFECLWGWPRVRGAEEKPAGFILRLSEVRNGPVIVLPKRAISDPAEQARLRALLQLPSPA